ncbi:toxin [Rickettsia hoogstraalii]|uniref:toxin n=1 Tax=Rickettsia hoogstraalii TaxID=467174 RepID=UPI00225B767C|nr:toxin [Rickettsia hoogstraalii]MCX4084029.1 toxin [Rickettsia hoogstraalii]
MPVNAYQIVLTKGMQNFIILNNMQKQYYFEFNQDKNITLLKERGVSFEQIITLIEQEDYVLNIQNHPNQDKYPNQKIYIVEIDRYCYLVCYKGR